MTAESSTFDTVITPISYTHPKCSAKTLVVNDEYIFNELLTNMPSQCGPQIKVHFKCQNKNTDKVTWQSVCVI